MDKEREIKKIAKILEEADCIEDALFIDFDRMAKAIIEAGYGDTKQAVREFAYEFKDRCVMELKPLAWEYGQGAEDVLKIFNKVLAEVTGE